ncbi:MAG: hypothetical protein UY74_C0023G0001, partial [Candidatus Kaiserbacteria bacterium GW2011_GWC2_52_8b]
MAELIEPIYTAFFESQQSLAVLLRCCNDHSCYPTIFLPLRNRQYFHAITIALTNTNI